MAEPEVRIEDESGDTRLAGSIFAPAGTASGRFLKTGANGATSWGTGGGGGGGVQVATVPISSAQILDLANTPVTLIPGVAGNFINVTGAAIAYVAGITPYLDGGGSLDIAIANQAIFGVTGAGFWDQATSQAAAQGYGGQLPAGASSGYAGVDVSVYEDTAAPTGGNGTLLVSLSYFLAPTV
jgi:hypothetical protein